MQPHLRQGVVENHVLRLDMALTQDNTPPCLGLFNCRTSISARKTLRLWRRLTSPLDQFNRICHPRALFSVHADKPGPLNSASAAGPMARS